MALQGFSGKMVNEKDAVEVIDFMLRGAGEESLGFEIERLAGEILTDDTDAGRTINIILKSRNTEASLDIKIAFLSDRMDLRIDHHQRHEAINFNLPISDPGPAGTIFYGGHHVNHGQLDGTTHLLGGETASFLLVHGDQHFLGEFHKGVVDLFDPATFAAQGRMAVFDNFQRLDFRRGFLSATHLVTGLVTAGMFLTPASWRASKTETTVPKGASLSACMVMEQPGCCF